MDYGLGVANSLIAAAAGVGVIQTTVSGIGERAGNTPMEEVVLALLTLYGIDTGIVTQKLTSLARLVAQLSGVEQPSNRAVTGSRLFDVESGIIAGWVRNTQDGDRAEALPYLPELVGQTGAHIVMGKGSGVDNVSEWLDRVGLTASDDQRLEILQQVKAFSLARKRLLTSEEFASIANTVTGVPAGQG
jgi:isopropylmalate/homocitrate/citramalate synthase